MPNQKKRNQLLIFVNLYQQAEKRGYFFVLFWRNSWFKNPANWLAESILVHISGRFLPVYDLCRNTANNINFHYTTNSVKINLNPIFFKISLNSRHYFCSLAGIFPQFLKQKKFFRKLQLCHTQCHKGPHHHANIWGNLLIPFQENNRQAGQKDGQTLFYRILLDTAGSLTCITAVDWHLKAKAIEHNVGPTKNSCITVKMQKISSIHKLILKIQ